MESPNKNIVFHIKMPPFIEPLSDNHTMSPIDCLASNPLKTPTNMPTAVRPARSTLAAPASLAVHRTSCTCPCICKIPTNAASASGTPFGTTVALVTHPTPKVAGSISEGTIITVSTSAHLVGIGVGPHATKGHTDMTLILSDEVVSSDGRICS